MVEVGVVGLGAMGMPMARNIIAGGHDVMAFDIAPDRLASLVDAGGVAAGSVTELTGWADLVVLSLPTTTALASVAAEMASARPDDLVVLETGTFPLEAKLAARDVLAADGIELMDTPVSGTGLQAIDGTLVVFASGSADGYERAAPVLDTLSRSRHFVGEFGNGSRMKYVANVLVCIHNLATAEAHVLGLAAGLEPAEVQRLMEDGVGSSKIFEIRGPMMVADDYPPAARLEIARKDSRIIGDYARSLGVSTPLLDLATQIYEEAAAEGLGELDAAAACRLLEARSGIQR